MNKKILFLDLDGTLLNDAKQITPGNRAALDEALRRGHRVVIATGRPLSSALDQAKMLGLDGPGCYLIAFNGGIVYIPSEQRVIFGKTLPISTAIAAIRLGESFDIHMQTYDEWEVLVEPRWDDLYLKFYCDRIKIKYQVVENLDTFMTREPSKVLAIGDSQQAMLPLKQALEAQFSDTLDCFFSDAHLMEIVPKGMNKGNAIRWTCETLGIPIADAIACGDEENDLTMIAAAGVGVAMANGVQKVKDLADYITTRDNNQDGIAEVVEKFLLAE